MLQLLICAQCWVLHIWEFCSSSKDQGFNFSLCLTNATSAVRPQGLNKGNPVSHGFPNWPA